MKRLLLLAIVCLPTLALADTVTLKDGSKIQGDVHRQGDAYVLTDMTGKQTLISVDDVARFELSPGAATGNDAAMSRLASLRRAADNLSDIKVIIERFKSFVAQNANTPAGSAAASDLRLWQDRLDQGLVKVADKWMTTQERDALRGQSTDLALQIHDMLKAGRLKEAAPILDRGILIDPKSISLLYLRGVLRYEEEHLPLSRKDFEAVIASAPDHAPTLNNLAVILWRENAHMVALGFYDRALLAAPGSQEILDNVAEALDALPREQRDTLVVKKLLRHFKEQDDALQKKMAEQGLYRYGGKWVTEKELGKIKEQEKAIKGQIAQMQTDFDTAQARITAIDRQVAELTNELNLIDAQTYAQGANGQVFKLPYPPLYYTLAQQVTTLKAERVARTDELDRLRQAARTARDKLPSATYSGLQKLIGVDGVPLPAGFVPAPAAPPPVRVPAPPRGAAPHDAAPAPAPAGGGAAAGPPVGPSAFAPPATAPAHATPSPRALLPTPAPATHQDDAAARPPVGVPIQ